MIKTLGIGGLVRSLQVQNLAPELKLKYGKLTKSQSQCVHVSRPKLSCFMLQSKNEGCRHCLTLKQTLVVKP